MKVALKKYLFFVVLTFLLIGFDYALANDFVLSPAKVEVFAKPGERIEKEINITNRLGRTSNFIVEVEDFIGFDVPSFKNYVKPEKSIFRLEDGEKINLKIEIDIPENAEPGGFYATVLVSPKRIDGESQAEVSLSARIGSRFFVRVEGEAEEAGLLEKFEKTDNGFSILFRNQGNVHSNLYGKIEIKNIFGKVVDSIEIDPYFSLPNSLRHREIEWGSEKGLGYYTAHLSLSRGYKDIIDFAKDSFFSFSSTGFVAIAVIILALITIILLFIVFRKNKSRKAMAMSLIIFSVLFSFSVLAEEMTSDNYIIQADSINPGGVLATTSNYQIRDTIGEQATGVSDSDNYSTKAGYQQMHEVSIAISAPSDITMSPNITTAGGTSNGSGSATATTDSASGYVLYVKASASPAMVSAGDSFADYTPAAAGTPDYTWAISASDSEFGFSPEGSHIVQKFQDNGSICNAGSNDTESICWYNLSTTDEAISQSYSANNPSGTATTVRFRAELGASHSQTAESYQAGITLTALAN